VLGEPPNFEEIQCQHVTKLDNNKSPGESGVPAEVLKALPPEDIAYVPHSFRIFGKEGKL
jgi:hypothetical protein